MGVEINGKNRWDIQVHDNDFYAKLATYNSLALGEAYIDESITIEDVLECVYRLTRGELFRGSTIMEYFNTQTRSRLSQAIKTHYGIDSEVFEATMDPAMLYSAGYWREATTLDDAQIAKMDLIGKKLMLKPGMKVLDIGCGWGGIAHHLAQNFGVHVVGITISVEQVKYAKEKFSHPNVEIQLVDYRDFKSNFKFDRVISIEMIEHIGEGNYTTFFKGIRDLLKDDGIFLLQTSGVCSPNFSNWDPFIHKYIFPDLLLTRQHHMTKYIDGLFCIEDWHDIGYDLSRTLAAWADNFERAWPSLRGKHGDEFYRMWTLFLRSLAGVLRSRKVTNWQLVMSKNGTEGGYLSVR